MNENELRDRIGGAFGVEPPAAGFESRMRSALTSPPPRLRTAAMRWPLEVAGGLIAVVVVVSLVLTHVAMTPSGPGPNVQAGTVPWADLPAPNVTQPFTKPGVLACRAGQLKFELNGTYMGSGPKDSSFWAVAVTNSSARECFVGPSMDVGFATAQGPVTIVDQRWGGDIVYLNPGARAIGELSTFPCRLPKVTSLTLSPGQGLGSVVLDPGPAGGWGTMCTGPKLTYLMELSPDTNSGGYVASTMTYMGPPAAAHPGDHLRFFITITNRMGVHFGVSMSPDPTPPPLAWSPCPTYHLELEGVPGSFHTYSLNCGAASTIPGNGSEMFEMFIDVPADAKTGPATLVWSIDGPPQRWQRASVFLPITT